MQCLSHGVKTSEHEWASPVSAAPSASAARDPRLPAVVTQQLMLTPGGPGRLVTEELAESRLALDFKTSLSFCSKNKSYNLDSRTPVRSSEVLAGSPCAVQGQVWVHSSSAGACHDQGGPASQGWAPLVSSSGPWHGDRTPATVRTDSGGLREGCSRPRMLRLDRHCAYCT